MFSVERPRPGDEDRFRVAGPTRNGAGTDRERDRSPPRDRGSAPRTRASTPTIALTSSPTIALTSSTASGSETGPVVVLYHARHLASVAAALAYTSAGHDWVARERNITPASAYRSRALPDANPTNIQLYSLASTKFWGDKSIPPLERAHVVVLDMAFSMYILTFIRRIAASLTVIDRHTPIFDVPGDRTLPDWYINDTTTCTAIRAWQHMHGCGPSWLRHVDERDRDTVPDTRHPLTDAFIAAVYDDGIAVKRLCELLHMPERDLDALIERGRVCVRTQKSILFPMLGTAHKCMFRMPTGANCGRSAYAFSQNIGRAGAAAATRAMEEALPRFSDQVAGLTHEARARLSKTLAGAITDVLASTISDTCLRVINGERTFVYQDVRDYGTNAYTCMAANTLLLQDVAADMLVAQHANDCDFVAVYGLRQDYDVMKWYITLRSCGRVNVGEVARAFGSTCYTRTSAKFVHVGNLAHVLIPMCTPRP